jgi:uncharacterized protein YutE (UPF0331/DUF86 family)
MTKLLNALATFSRFFYSSLSWELSIDRSATLTSMVIMENKRGYRHVTALLRKERPAFPTTYDELNKLIDHYNHLVCEAQRD